MPRVRPVLILLALVAVAVAYPAGAASPQHHTRVYTLEPSGNPEGIAYDQRRHAFYVSDVFTGGIYRGTLDDPVVHLFLPGGDDGRTQAVGLKVDKKSRLYVAGGATGAVFVYDTRTGELLARFDTGSGGFLNDLVVTKRGDVYVTDSFRPVLWRITAEMVEAGAGVPQAIPLLPEVVHVPGFNVNGIVETSRGDLIVVNMTTGKLYRISPTENPLVRTIVEIPVAGGPLTNADGLVLEGTRLYAIQNAQELVTEVKLDGRTTHGVVVSRTTDPTFHTPTTAARARNRLLVVNSEFFETDGPPYTVSSIPLRGGEGGDN